MAADAVTRFLNVDLEIVSSGNIDPLLARLLAAMFTLRDSIEGGRRTVWMELAGDVADPNATVLELTRLIVSLPPDLRALWDACEDRCLNVGIQGGMSPHASAFRIAASTILEMAATSARLEFTIYGAAASDGARRQSRVT
jgi:hypothetical protein